MRRGHPRRAESDASGRAFKAKLLELQREDPGAYHIGFALAMDWIAVDRGEATLAEVERHGLGYALLGDAPASLRKRARSLGKVIHRALQHYERRSALLPPRSPYRRKR